MPLQPSRTIRHADLGDVIVILDLTSESYHVLDPAARSMWNHLLRLPARADVLVALQQEYVVEPSRLEADLDAFVERVVAQGFLETRASEAPIEGPPPAAPAKRGCLAWRAWLCLAMTARSLATRGFSSTYLRYARLPAPATPADGDRAQELLRRGVAAFRRAEGFFYMRRAPQDCLPRSLALFRFLRSLGLPVEHRIGVKRFPFTAHAWVEFRDAVVHESEAVCRTFTPVATLPS